MTDPEIRIDWLDARTARDEWLAESEEWLDAPERARLGRFLVAHAARDFLLGRWLARRALAARTGVGPDRWRFEIAAHGRPVPSCEDVCATPSVNLSHGGGLVVCASSADLQLGVDVEATGRPPPTRHLERFLTSDELRCLATPSGGPTDDRFWRIWTLKEAVLKARGTGIAGALASVSIQLDPPDHPGSAHCDGGWHLVELQPTPEHRLAVAALDAGARPRIVVRAVTA